MKTLYFVLSVINFISAAGFSVKSMFVTPTLPSVYYGITALVCAFGFWIISKLEQ